MPITTNPNEQPNKPEHPQGPEPFRPDTGTPFPNEIPLEQPERTQVDLPTPQPELDPRRTVA